MAVIYVEYVISVSQNAVNGRDVSAVRYICVPPIRVTGVAIGDTVGKGA